jgi:hypothetical protein
LCFCVLSLLVPNLGAQEEHTFDLSEIKKKELQFGGFLEFRPLVFSLDREAQFYKLRFYEAAEEKTVSEYNFRALLNLDYQKGIFGTTIRLNSEISNSFFGWAQKTALFEAFLSVKPSISFQADFGKRRMKWGKGYAWNPVAFIDRPKNPNDPELALEGYVVLSLDYIKSFQGELKTFTFTPVLIPVSDTINSTFGDRKGLNVGGKFYFLFYDTDIDFLFLTGRSLPARYGMDFSRNISSNFEIHGEFAFVPAFSKMGFDSNGQIMEKKVSSTSVLLGSRYLTPTNITFIFEYLKNGSGYTSSEMDFFYSLIDSAYQLYVLNGDKSQLDILSGPATQSYRTFAPMKDYLYLRISQKEPWNIPYFFPAITSIMNLKDKSFSLAAELFYKPITNLEFRAKATALLGQRGSEFGEKQSDVRFEFRGRYYF